MKIKQKLVGKTELKVDILAPACVASVITKAMSMVRMGYSSEVQNTS